MNALQIDNLHASIAGKEILRGVSLAIKPGEIHVLMGPNGSGKSTLAHLLMGKPDVTVSEGSVTLDSEDLLALPVHERARRGLFLGFQYPLEIPGVTISHFLRLANNSRHSVILSERSESKDLAGNETPPFDSTRGKLARDDIERGNRPLSIAAFRKQLEAAAASLNIPKDLLSRDLNVGFSGGEKKRLEMLQLLLLEPKFAILDETDSGLDIDALKLISKTIQKAAKEQNVGVLLITHYTRILKELDPDAVHVFIDGKIVQSGDKELAEELEKNGYLSYTTPQSSSRVEPRDLAATI